MRLHFTYRFCAALAFSVVCVNVKAQLPPVFSSAQKENSKR
jgi:hypothetical protein